MKITKAMIEAAERRGACGPALSWLRATPRTVPEMIRERLHWYLWAMSYVPSLRPALKKHFDAAISENATYAASACRFMTIAQANRCAERCDADGVWDLLEAAKAKLTHESLKRLYSLRPLLFVIKAPELLTDATLNELAPAPSFYCKNNPAIWARLTPETQAAILKVTTA